MKPHFFGTDGIRGTYGKGFLNEKFAYALGKAAGAYFAARFPGEDLKVLIGRDTRSSGDVLARYLMGGLKAARCRILDAGVCPTPVLAFGAKEQKVTFAVMLTASHNPPEDNGFKFFHREIRKLTPSEELSLESFLPSLDDLKPQTGVPDDIPDIVQPYLDAQKAFFPKDCLSGVKVAVDMAHGATCGISNRLMESLGATVHSLHEEPDGERINLGCGSEATSAFGEWIFRGPVIHAGIAHDGDGDRMVVLDEAGNPLSGEAVMGLLAQDLKEQECLPDGRWVTTEQTNFGLDRYLKTAGIQTVRCPIGDRWVAAAMAENGLTFGGENSGHLIFSDWLPTGDGMHAAVRLLQLIFRKHQTLSKQAKTIPLLPCKTFDYRVTRKSPIEDFPELFQLASSIRSTMGSRGRIFYRYSGTEPKLRVLLESADPPVLEKCAQQWDEAAKRVLPLEHRA